MLVRINSDLKNYFNLSLENRNIIILQDFSDSIGNKEKNNRADHQAPIGISKTFKDYFDIRLALYRDDEKEKICAKETNHGEEYLLDFEDSNKLAQYIECLTYLGIFCKINGTQATIKHQQDLNNSDNELRLVNSDYIEVTIGEKVIKCNVKELLESMKSWLKDISFSFNMNDIMHARLSQYETRKMIATQYSDITLTQEELKSLAYYKAGYFEVVNLLLRGQLMQYLDHIVGKEHFFQTRFPDYINTIINIYKASRKFVAHKDIWLLRGITHFDELNISVSNVIECDNFLSTSITSRLFNYRLNGVSYNDFIHICIPKGTHFVPMDLISERRMDDDESFNLFGGSTGSDEGEYLLPMCEALVLENDKTFKNRRLLKLRVQKELNLQEVLLKRVTELKDIIVKYTSLEFYEEILEKINNLENAEKRK